MSTGGERKRHFAPHTIRKKYYVCFDEHLVKIFTFIRFIIFKTRIISQLRGVKERQLTFGQFANYEKVVSQNETIRVMREIDWLLS